MAQVSSQAQLSAALNIQEPFIQITADFSLTSQINILYDVTIESLIPGTYTISKAPGYDSYLFRIQNDGILRLTNIVIDGQSQLHDPTSAAARALIYVTGGSLYMDNGAVLKDNVSYGSGGGVWLYGGGSYTNKLQMAGDARVTGCSARTNGGGISVSLSSPDDIISISDRSMIDHNFAVNGGGIYYYSTIQGVGGTLAISGDVQIVDNAASSTGGGICFSGYRAGGSSPSFLSLGGSLIFSGNTAVHGAAIYFYGTNDGDHMSVTDGVSIDGNTAAQNGGGICCITPTGSAEFLIANSSITHNTGGTGGGIYLLTNSGGAVTFLETVISENTAQNGAAGSGGGVWFQNSTAERPVIISLNGTQIMQNDALAQGGGIYLIGGPGAFSFRMSKSSVSENTAATNGGGLLMSSAGGVIDVQESTIEGNTAGGSGGGFYYANSREGTSAQIHLTKDTISGNRAGREGGGLRFSSSLGAVITDITDGQISGNTADTNSGGGIWHGGNSDTLTLHGSAAVTGNVSREGNGGGIYFNSDSGTLLLTDQVKIIDNRADERVSSFGSHGGGICVVPGNVTISGQAEIADNSARLYGGGISMSEQSRIDFLSGSIHNNRSARYGGAVWCHDRSIFFMSGGSIMDNQAVYGGGFYNDAVLRITGGMVSRNNADVGGGIYNEGNFYTKGLRDITKGVYIFDENAVVRIEGELAPGSKIQIESSEYVSPNSEGRSIVIGEASPPYTLLNENDRAAFLKPPSGFEGWEVRLSSDLTQVLLVPIQYAIHYENLRGASNTNPDVYKVTEPDIVLVPPGKITGYRFIGWFDAPEGGNQVTRIVQGTTGDITLYARWEMVSFTITYDANDGGGSCACGIPRPESFQEGQQIRISNLIPVRPCFVFGGWNTRRDGTGIGYIPGTVVGPLPGDTILYAVWRICCCPSVCEAPCCFPEPPCCGYPCLLSNPPRSRYLCLPPLPPHC